MRISHNIFSDTDYFDFCAPSFSFMFIGYYWLCPNEKYIYSLCECLGNTQAMSSFVFYELSQLRIISIHYATNTTVTFSLYISQIYIQEQQKKHRHSHFWTSARNSKFFKCSIIQFRKIDTNYLFFTWHKSKVLKNYGVNNSLPFWNPIDRIDSHPVLLNISILDINQNHDISAKTNHFLKNKLHITFTISLLPGF